MVSEIAPPHIFRASGVEVSQPVLRLANYPATSVLRGAEAPLGQAIYIRLTLVAGARNAGFM